MATTDTPDGATGLLGAATGTWTLDPSATTIKLQTKALYGLVKVKGTFKAVEGGGTVSADGAVSGHLLVDASSIDTGNKKRDNHLRSDDFFETTKNPTFLYTATGATLADDHKINVKGTLTINGQTRPLDLVATVTHSGTGTATLDADFDLDRSEWGVSWAKMGAKLANQISVSARFTKT